MDVVYFNGPVQNADFSFAERPGKAVGIRMAEALNGLLGLAPVPHLWNTVTLAGDVRHRCAADRDTVGREQRERGLSRRSTRPARFRRAGCSPTPPLRWPLLPWR